MPPNKARKLARERIEKLLVNRGTRTIASIAEELGVTPSSLYAAQQRINKQKKVPASDKPKPGSVAASASLPPSVPSVIAENTRLRQENERLRANLVRANGTAGSPAGSLGDHARLAKQVALLKRMVNVALDTVGLELNDAPRQAAE